MLPNIFKGLLRRPLIAALYFLLITLSLILLCLGTILSAAAESSQAETREYTEIATFRPDASYGHQRTTFFQNDVESFVNILKADQRTFAAGYSETLEPVFLPYHAASSRTAYWSPQDLAIFVATCTGVEEEHKKIAYYYEYTYQINEVIYQNEKIPRVDVITCKNDIAYQPGPLVEVGKTYLIWGHYNVSTEGEAELWCPIARGEAGGVKAVEQNGLHTLKEIGRSTFNFVPLVSELNEPVEDFWKTEVGQIWQKTVMAKIPICQHSVTVVGTDHLESIYAFNQDLCTIVSGEDFTETHYEDGERVCLISEEMAQLNGLSVGDIIPLKLYDADYRYERSWAIYYRDSYDPSVGFVENGEWRIIAIYHTDYEPGQEYVIHPNTVFVPNGSLQATYRSNYVPLMSLSYILPENGWNSFLLEADAFGYGNWFVYGDGGRARVEEENTRRQTALSEWQSAVTKWTRPLPALSVILMAVSLLLWVLNKKKEIGHFYAIETSRGVLFAHFFLQSLLIGVLALGVSALIGTVLVNRAVPELLHRLADPDYAELLMSGIKEEALSLFPILGRQAWIFTVLAAACAAIGAVRRYQFEYHDKE